MKSISSRDNPQFKELKLLATSASARRKAGNTVLDGVHLCQTYLDRVGAPLLCVVGDSSLMHPEVMVIVARCEELKTPCLALPEAMHQAISQVESGIGLLFVISTPHTSAPVCLDDAAVLLDNLQDPGNVGSILRSAAAAGIKTVITARGTAFAWSPKVLRAGMGAHFFMNIVENADLLHLLSTAKVPVLATSSHAAQSLYAIDLSKPVAWLFGNEGAGVRPELLELASARVVIPHRAAMESLNVAACAAICLFEQVRQQSLQ